MTVSARRAAFADEADIVAMAIAMLEATRPYETYDRTVLFERLRSYLKAADAAVWVAECEGAIIGFLLGTVILFDWRRGCCTLARMRHTVSGVNGAEANDLLTRAFLAWSRDCGAEEVYGLQFDPSHLAVMRKALGAEKLNRAGLQ